MFGLQHPLTCKPWTTLSNPCNKVRGKYVVKEVFLRPLFLRLPSCIYLSACVCLYYYWVVMIRQISIQHLETGVQSQVESYQRLKKWYLIPTYLSFRIIRYVSRVKWSNPGMGVVPSPTPWCSSYWKGSLQVAFTTVADFTYMIIKYMIIIWQLNMIIIWLLNMLYRCKIN